MSVSKEFVMTLLGRGIAVPAGLITSILTARYLGPEGRGVLFVIIAAAQLAAQFGSVGLASSNTYLVARDPNTAPRLLANSIWASMICGAVAAGLILIFMSAGSEIFEQSVVILPFLSIGMLLFLLSSNLLVGLGWIGRFNIIQVVNVGLGLVLYIGVAIFDLGLTGFLLASLVTALLSGLLCCRAVWRPMGIVLTFCTNLFRKGFNYSLRAYLATVLGFLILRGIVLLMSRMLTSEEIGYYSVASQIGDTFLMLPQAFALVLFPRLVREGGGRWASLLRMMTITLSVMGALCALMYWIMPVFIVLLFGEAFAEAVSVSRWFLLTVLFGSLVTVLSQYFAASGFPWLVVCVWSAGLAITIGTASLLLPSLRAEGAAIALAFGYCMIGILLLFCVPSQLRSSLKGRA